MLLGPMTDVFPLIGTSIKEYFTSFFASSVVAFQYPDEDWSRSWTVFYLQIGWPGHQFPLYS